MPSRTQPGNFFALPQSPQLMKQLLMMAGLDRYYQIVKCFRDEDLRADRQPEFTQLDIETSFMNEEDLMKLMEELLRDTFKSVLGVELPMPFPRLTYADSMRRFGNDKPDLRIPLELVEVADLFRGVEFKVFAGPAADPASRIAALRLPKGGELTRKEIDDYTALVARHGAKGLAYIKVNERAKGRDGLQSPILKFLPDAAVNGVLDRVGRRGRRPRVLRRGQSPRRQRVVERVASRARARPQARRRRVAAAVDRRLSDVRSAARRRLDAGASSVHVAARPVAGGAARRARRRRSRAPTTSC